MVWSLLSLWLIQSKQLPWAHHHWSSQPCLAHCCSHGSQLPCKSHAFTMWNSLRMLPDHSTQEFSVLLWSLPCHMKETCCGELSGLQLSPPAGAGSEETVSQYKRWDFLRHLSSSLPASCCTQERFNGLEEISSAYCHRTQKPGPPPKQETENLSCEPNRTNWLDYCSVGKAQSFYCSWTVRAQRCGQPGHGSTRKWLCREQPASQTRHKEAGRRQG